MEIEKYTLVVANFGSKSPASNFLHNLVVFFCEGYFWGEKTGTKFEIVHTAFHNCLPTMISMDNTPLQRKNKQRKETAVLSVHYYNGGDLRKKAKGLLNPFTPT